MFLVEFNAFLEVVDSLVILLSDGVNFSKTIVCSDIVGTHGQALSIPADCFLLLTLSCSEKISKAEVSIDIIFVELDAFLEIIDCLIVLASFLIDKSEVIVRNFIGRMTFNALFEKSFCFIDLLFDFEGKA